MADAQHLTEYEAYIRHLLYGTIPEWEMEDMVQEVYLSALRTVELFEERCHWKTWLFRIVVAVRRDYYRRLSKPKRNAEVFSLDVVYDDSGEGTRWMEEYLAFDPWPALEACLVAPEILKRLPADYGKILKERFLDGLSLSEVAETYGGKNAAKCRTYRALKYARRRFSR